MISNKWKYFRGGEEEILEIIAKGSLLTYDSFFCRIIPHYYEDTKLDKVIFLEGYFQETPVIQFDSEKAILCFCYSMPVFGDTRPDIELSEEFHTLCLLK